MTPNYSMPIFNHSGKGTKGRENENGEEVRLDEPSGDELPPNGFDAEDPGFQAPAEDGSSVVVSVNDDSERLQLLAPFTAWDGKNITGAINASRYRYVYRYGY